MDESPREKRLFNAFFLGLIALHVALVLSARLFPFTDLPDHLAAATIERFAGDPSSPLAEYYRVETFLKPNTAHLLLCGLKVLPSVELSNRLLLALYAILLPASVLLAIRKLGGNPRLAFLSFLLMYNYNVSWGFVGFVLAIPLVILFSVFFVLDERGVASVSHAAGAAAFLVLLYFVHLLAALFCVLVLFLRLVVRDRGALRALGGSLAASLPLAVLVAVWWRGEARDYAGAGLLPFLSHYYRSVFVGRFLARKSIFIFDNYHLFAGAAGYAAAASFSLAIVACAALSFFRGRAPEGARASRAALPFLAAALLSCLLLPNEIPQQSILYERFSVFLLLALIIWGAARAPERLPRAAAGMFVALALLHYGLWTNYIFDFNRENAGFDRAFLRPARSGMKLAGLVNDYTYRGRPVYIHFPSYYIVWEKGVATATLTDFRFGPVRRRVSALELPRYLEWAGKLGSYDGRYRDMDYLLTRGGAPPAGFAVARSAGRWSLCERAVAAP